MSPEPFHCYQYHFSLYNTYGLFLIYKSILKSGDFHSKITWGVEYTWIFTQGNPRGASFGLVVVVEQCFPYWEACSCDFVGKILCIKIFLLCVILLGNFIPGPWVARRGGKTYRNPPFLFVFRWIYSFSLPQHTPRYSTHTHTNTHTQHTHHGPDLE